VSNEIVLRESSRSTPKLP